MKPAQKTLAELAELINAELKGDANCIISGMATLQDAMPGRLSFLTNPKYQHQLSTTKASAVILTKEFSALCPTNALVVDDPQFAYALLANLFARKPHIEPGIHASAVIGDDCTIPSSVSIGANVVVSDRVTIGENTQIGAGCFIGEESQIGSDCHLRPNVTLYEGVLVGDRVLLHSGVVIGSDGFSMAKHEGRWHKIQQLGSVVIGNEVEIGANTTIDRGALNNTIIEEGVKLDNLIQIAHNVHVGAHTAIAGCAGIAGSTTIGKHCMIGGAVGISGHLEIADQVIITAMSGVSNSIKESGVYSSGWPCMKNRDFNKAVARFRQLDKVANKIRALENKLEKEDPIKD